MKVQGLLNICRQNIVSAERDDISRVIDRIKSASSKGHVNEYEDSDLHEKTVKFLQDQNFRVKKEDYRYEINWEYPVSGEAGSLLKEAINNVRIHRRNKMISDIKFETYLGKSRLVYKGVIDDDVKKELDEEGFCKRYRESRLRIFNFRSKRKRLGLKKINY